MSVTLEQLKQKSSKLKQRLTELEATIKAYEEQKEAEFPKDGDEVYYINAYGYILNANFCEGYDNDVLAIGNCFRTQEEAEDAVEQLKVIAEQRKHGWKVGAIHFVNSEGKFNVHSFKVR